MLKIFDSSYGLDIALLQQVYLENPSEYFYEDTLDFLAESQCAYAVWIVNGIYVSALRWQSFGDGFLISGIETHPDERRNGYAKCLLRCVLEYYSANGTRKVYSHIRKDNQASLNLHLKCGFETISDYAHLLDGSVSRQYNTFLITI